MVPVVGCEGCVDVRVKVEVKIRRNGTEVGANPGKQGSVLREGRLCEYHIDIGNLVQGECCECGDFLVPCMVRAEW